jgi:hypothetical protein
MDFSRAAERYCALGEPADVAEAIRAFHAAGMRHLVINVLAPESEKAAGLVLTVTAVLVPTDVSMSSSVCTRYCHLLGSLDLLTIDSVSAYEVVVTVVSVSVLALNQLPDADLFSWGKYLGLLIPDAAVHETITDAELGSESKNPISHAVTTAFTLVGACASAAVGASSVSAAASQIGGTIRDMSLSFMPYSFPRCSVGDS